MGKDKFIRTYNKRYCFYCGIGTIQDLVVRKGRGEIFICRSCEKIEKVVRVNAYSKNTAIY
jgi:hypothetical protein